MAQILQSEPTPSRGDLSEGQSRQPGSSKVAAMFRAAAARAISFLETCLDVSFSPLHPEFRIRRDGWQANRFWGPFPEPPFKVCAFFDDLHLLDGCPFVAKFGDNLDDRKAFKYFAVIYGKPSITKGEQSLPEVEAWASRFPIAAVFTYGGSGTSGEWRPGEYVRDVNSSPVSV